MFTDRLFTGQREMVGLGLYDYNARFFSPKLGRFISADTMIPGPSDSQSLNRYTYAGNNPIIYNDPSGHFINLAFAGVGALLGGLIGAGTVAVPQMIRNVQQGQALTSNIKLADVGKAAAIGAVVGAVGGLTFGLGLAAGGAIAGAMGITASSGVAATIAGLTTIAVSGVLAGQASRATMNLLTQRNLGTGLWQPRDMAVDAVSSVVMFKALGGNFNQVLPSSTTELGAFAEQGVTATGPRVSRPGQSAQIQALGEEYGCHTCGSMDPGPRGVWYGDHQPPTSLAQGQPQLLYPQCSYCSNSQGGFVGAGTSRFINAIREGAWRGRFSWGPLWMALDQDP